MDLWIYSELFQTFAKTLPLNLIAFDAFFESPFEWRTKTNLHDYSSIENVGTFIENARTFIKNARTFIENVVLFIENVGTFVENQGTFKENVRTFIENIAMFKGKLLSLALRLRSAQ
jgi:hypothetical protein